MENGFQMMNQDNPYAMNQTCKVCGEPAAGFHFGAFTCEGCKSFFGRSYNNLSSIADCKNNGECIINKKNRTACKACRLRKCILVGMSKSGSRYGRRSNWFKIHCLLQEQQQQQQAAFAAHHSQQQPGQPGQSPTASLGMGQKLPQAAAATALSMLGHHAGATAAAAYPGLFPPRTKEELMMLGLEEYAAAKHSAAIAAASSPSVSSPESHNSDSSVEVNVRSNPMLHLSGKHVLEAAVAAANAGGGSGGNSGAPPPPPQLRKDLPAFLPLHFPTGLATMSVMPPPSFLPPSHLLFPGYHPALYPHHQGLLKPLPEQQQAAAAAAMQQLFASSATSTSGGLSNRYAAAAAAAAAATASTPGNTLAMHSPVNRFTLLPTPESSTTHATAELTTTTPPSALHNNNNNSSNNNNIDQLHNGSKAAEEFSKHFYLNAFLKSQCESSPSPPPSTKLTATSSASVTTATTTATTHKHDHSISALFTPNSESGRATQREFRKSLHSNEGKPLAARESPEYKQELVNGDGASSDCDEDLVVSMTPPRSPLNAAAMHAAVPPNRAAVKTQVHGEDNPIDLSMKQTCGEQGESESAAAIEVESCSYDDENAKKSEIDELETASGSDADGYCDEDGETSTAETVKSAVHIHQLNSQNNNNNNNNKNINNNSSCSSSSADSSRESTNQENQKKRKTKRTSNSDSADATNTTAAAEKISEHQNDSKRVKLLLEAENVHNLNMEQKILRKVSPLDLTTKV